MKLDTLQPWKNSKRFLVLFLVPLLLTPAAALGKFKTDLEGLAQVPYTPRKKPCKTAAISIPSGYNFGGAANSRVNSSFCNCSFSFFGICVMSVL